MRFARLADPRSRRRAFVQAVHDGRIQDADAGHAQRLHRRLRDGAGVHGTALGGHQQAAEFYRVFLSSLQGTQWVPQAALVIDPQGVLDVVNMTGTRVKESAGLKDVDAQVHLQWVIYFPWVPDARKFNGEVIYSIRPL
ncbi:MAG: hypothetical protein WBE14_20785 [Xanthobacteraceae bacterium]